MFVEFLGILAPILEQQIKTKVRLETLEKHLNLTYIPEGKSEARYEITKTKNK